MPTKSSVTYNVTIWPTNFFKILMVGCRSALARTVCLTKKDNIILDCKILTTLGDSEDHLVSWT